MRLRPQRHHHAEALSVPITTTDGSPRPRSAARTRGSSLPRLCRWSALVLIAAIPVASGLLAASQELAPNGTLHSILVEARSTAAPAYGGTRLVHRIQTPDERIDARAVPGTDEPVLDIEPAISLSPSTGLPALVWSRLDGGTDYEIMVSFFDGTRWSTPRVITANSWDDRRAQIVCGRSGYVHLLWNGPVQPDGSPLLYESILDWKGVTIQPPTPVRVSAMGTVSSPGGSEGGGLTTDTASVPPTFGVDENLFVVDSSIKFQGRVSAYGGYDEPVPIIHRMDFLMPGSSPVERTRIAVVGSRIVVFARSSGRLYYSVQNSNGWTPLRSITLDSITDEQAEVLILGMLARNTAG